ncbi:flavodoxin, partial [Xanthomonas hortorum pv. cynarae]|nr:flavodoxin [Xanthomonas hortorum pv. cynarae]
MNILLALASLSGNTRDVARSVSLHCEAAGHA